jgi:ketosteroid isomerase-like protein
MARKVSTLWAVLAVGLLAACQADSAQEQAEASEAELLVRMLGTAIESADTALILDIFWPEATYDDFPNQITHEGPQEIVAYLTAAHVWGDDVYMSFGRIHVGNGMATGEWVFSAVQSRPMPGQVPITTGNEGVFNGVTIIEIQDGRIIRAADYADTAPLTLQLGGTIEFPGNEGNRDR